ncbi:Putative ubiquitin-conjugating enzyme/RWD [Septoria linicola]|uniref:Ubiquitin-conjugating enzyme/RWD n=1 Tax=Septoria linicola TaxID=215465 RepID=A0A9Q9ADJ0_9PEZI|nr:putative ubiquitin-conjugating enzyme/RWD [Septoria linicola]USW47554.1 Putative ubiquitin-conjugating enzyme/RWD [Septoria linicola]
MADSHLPLEVLEGQLDTYLLLDAMYPATDGHVRSTENEAIISDLRHWLEHQTSSPQGPEIPDALSLVVSIHETGDDTRSICVDVSIPLGRLSDPEVSENIQLYKLRVLQPDWLTKAEVAQLSQDMPTDDVVSALEHIAERASEAALSRALQNTTIASQKASGPLVRVWFYFPSISTREKRDDIVNYAPSYGLTGFLLAGKPGILCLEGDAPDIDDYMKLIKTESWGDIPAGHKKVSERLRESGDGVGRTFSGMEEITDSIEKRGARGNRGNMQAVEVWLEKRGLGSAFAKVLM